LVSAVAVAGVTVCHAARAPPPADPPHATLFGAPTALVLTVKVAVVPPPGTVTLAGTVAAPVLLLDSDTTAPPLGAGSLSVTVPVAELPPATLDGLALSEGSVAGAVVKVGGAVCV